MRCTLDPYDVNQDNTNWLRHWAHNISPATFCSHLLTMRLQLHILLLCLGSQAKRREAALLAMVGRECYFINNGSIHIVHDYICRTRHSWYLFSYFFFNFFRFLVPSTTFNNFKFVPVEQRKLKIFGHLISLRQGTAGSEWDYIYKIYLNLYLCLEDTYCILFGDKCACTLSMEEIASW